MPESNALQSIVDTHGAAFREFWDERHVGTITTVRADGSAHVVPVGVTLDPEAGVARVICSSTSHKARQIRAAGERGAAVAVHQRDGRRWSTLEGRAVIRDTPDAVAEAEHHYEQRYRKTPRANPKRVVIEITVRTALGSV